MKKLFRLLPLLAFQIAVWSQTVPPSYPYPGPLPTNGNILGPTLKVTGPVNPTSYADPFPAMWDVFLGGGYRSVSDTNELYSINMNRRKEGMQVFVKDSSFGSSVYSLLGGLSNTNWVRMGSFTTNGFSAFNIYNTDGSLETDRLMIGNLKDLTLGQSPSFPLKDFTVNYFGSTLFSGLGTNDVFRAENPEADVTLDGPDLKVNVPNGGLYLFTSGASTNDPTGYVWTALDNQGLGEWQPAAGQNFANSDLTFTGARAHDAAGYAMSITNLDSLAIGAVNDITVETESTLNLTSTDDDVLVTAFDSVKLQSRPSSPGPNINVQYNKLVLDSKDKNFQLITPQVTLGDTNVTVGMALTLLNTNGVADWATVTGGTNYFNITNTYVADNFANTDLTFTGNRTHDAAGYDFQVQGGNAISLSSTNYVEIVGENSIGFHAEGTGTRVYTYNVQVGPGISSGQVLTAQDNLGTVEFAEAPNFATTDLTFTGDRLHDVAGYNLSITNVNNLVLGGTDNLTYSDNSVILGGTDNVITNSPGSVVIASLGGGNSVTDSEFGSYGSFVIGGANVVSAGFTGTIGFYNDVSGQYSIVLGDGNTVSANPGFAIGEGNNLSSDYTFAFGKYNNISGYGSYAIGGWDIDEANLITGQYNISIGAFSPGSSNLISGELSAILSPAGGVTITGTNSIAIGSNSTVAGDYNLLLSAAGSDEITGGSYNVVLSTGDNTMDGAYNVSIGYGNIFDASSYDNHALGDYNEFSSNANYAKAIGDSNFVGAAESTVIGSYTATINYGELAFGNGYLIDSQWLGSFQQSTVFSGAATTDDTPEILTTNWNGNDQVIQPASSTWLVEQTIVGMTPDAAMVATYIRRYTITRPNNEASTAIIGSIQVVGVDTGTNAGVPPADWSILIEANTIDGGPMTTVTGGASDSIRWHSVMKINQVVYVD